MFLCLQKLLHVRQQDVAGRKQTGAEPQQLPALLLAVPGRTEAHGVSATITDKVQACQRVLLDVVVGQLFEDLTEDLVLERLSLQRALKNLIGELVDRTHPFGGVVAHVLHHGCRQVLRTMAVKGQLQSN